MRTPMQWLDQLNGGFSTAEPAMLPHPVISEDEYGYSIVNVALQQQQPTSLLNWMGHLIRTRRQCPEFGSGQWRVLPTDEIAVCAHLCKANGTAMLALHNLSSQPCGVTLPELDYDHWIEVFNDNFSLVRSAEAYTVPDRSIRSFKLNVCGYRWFRVTRQVKKICFDDYLNQWIETKCEAEF